MKRSKLLKYLKEYSCKFLREGGRHTIYINSQNGKVSAIPRHNDIKDNLAVKICKDLGIPNIKKRNT